MESIKKNKGMFIIFVAMSSPVILSTAAVEPSKIQVPLKQLWIVFPSACSAAVDEYEYHSQTVGKGNMNGEYETLAKCCTSRSAEYSSISLRPTSLHSTIHTKGSLNTFLETALQCAGGLKS